MNSPEIMEPSACTWCSVARRGHGRQYADAVGYHEWEAPSDAQILARMKARRLALVVARVGALPVPVGPEPQAESLPLKVVAELNDLRMRLAGMANPPREVFLALYEGAEPELFTTVEAARECCDDLAKADAYGKYWDWTVNECGIHIQFWTHPDDDRPTGDTSGSVTPVVVQGDEPVSELEQLRREVENNRVDSQRLIRAEQRRAELEAVHETHRKDDQAEIERLRRSLREACDQVAELEAAYGVSVAEASSLEGQLAEVERVPFSLDGVDEPAKPDTLAAWLRQRFTASAVTWESLDANEREYWEHQANAVRRAVARGGFKAPSPSVEESADKLARLIAPVQALREDDGYESPLHHTYRTGRDLPETGGAK